MARELNELNRREAYCKVLVCTGIGAAGTPEGCKDLMDKIVWVVVPESMHESFPAKLIACTVQICTDEPYEWKVINEEPEITENTTFEKLYQEWFKEILWPHD